MKQLTHITQKCTTRGRSYNKTNLICKVIALKLIICLLSVPRDKAYHPVCLQSPYMVTSMYRDAKEALLIHHDLDVVCVQRKCADSLQ